MVIIDIHMQVQHSNYEMHDPTDMKLICFFFIDPTWVQELQALPYTSGHSLHARELEKPEEFTENYIH